MRKPTAATRDHLVAFVWGAAEASFFFVVPDVWLSRIALRSPRRAAAASLSACAGAVLGGALTYAWARRVPAGTSRQALRRVPAVSGAMIDRCEREVTRVGNRAMLGGPMRGVPYKLYARAAGLRHTSRLGFVAWTPPARLPRFLLVTGLATASRAATRRWLGDGDSDRRAAVAHAVGWTVFYAWFLHTVGREEEPTRATVARPRSPRR